MPKNVLWKAAAIGDESGFALRDMIVRDFLSCYSHASKPAGAALFELTDSGGDLSSVYLTPAAVAHCTSLFEAYRPWLDCLPPRPAIATLTWIAGDPLCPDYA